VRLSSPTILPFLRPPPVETPTGPPSLAVVKVGPGGWVFLARPLLPLCRDFLGVFPSVLSSGTSSERFVLPLFSPLSICVFPPTLFPFLPYSRNLWFFDLSLFPTRRVIRECFRPLSVGPLALRNLSLADFEALSDFSPLDREFSHLEKDRIPEWFFLAGARLVPLRSPSLRIGLENILVEVPGSIILL